MKMMLLRLTMIAAVVIAGAAASGNIAAITNMAEKKLVYPFDSTRVPPASVDLPGITEQQVQIGGETLVVWTAPAKASKPTILYFHGNAGNLAIRAGRFQRFLKRGYGLVAPAYRGSSGSTGTPSEKALTRDAVKLYRNLHKLIPGLTPDDIVIYGESLGTGVALKLIAQRNTPQPGAVVLEAPFTSLPEVVLHSYPQFEPIMDRMKNIWDNQQHASALMTPLLILHGTDDRLIPIEQGRQIYATVPSPAKRLLAVPGAGHTDIWRTDSLPVLWRFIDQF